MEDIAKLRERLRALQEEESVQRLSERNCVELLFKLRDSGALKILHTLDGKEYVTPEHLDLEIKDEVIAHGGRVNVLDLQPLLNMDLIHIEARVSEILHRDRSMLLLNGELISKYYLDGIAEEVNEMLQEAGSLQLPALTVRFNLPLDNLRSVISDRLNRKIKGTLEETTLYTQVYVARCKAQLRGLINAITRPCPISQISAQLGTSEKLFAILLEQLTKEGQLPGVVERGIYLPAIFSHARQAWIESFFAQNGYIEYQNLVKQGVTDARQFLKKLYPDGVALRTCYVSPSLVKRVEDAIEFQVFQQHDAVDILAIADIPLSDSDAATLLKACPIVNQAGNRTAYQFLGDRFVVSEQFLERCVESFTDEIDREAPIRIAEAAELLAKAPPPDKKAKGKQQQQAKGGKGGKKPQRGGNKRGGRGKGDEDDDDEGPAASSANTPSLNFDDWLTDQQIEEKLRSWYTGSEEEMLGLVAEKVGQKVRRKAQEVGERVVTDIAAGSAKDRKEIEKQFATTYHNILLFRAAYEGEVTDTYLQDVLRRHLLATLCTQAVNLVLRMVAIHHALPIAFEAPEAVSSAEREKILGALPLSVASQLTPWVATLKGTSVDDFLNGLDRVAGVCQIHLKKLDKKKLRSVAHAQRLDFLQQLKESSDPATVLHLATVSAWAQLHGYVLHMPSSGIPTLLNHLEGLDEETLDALKELSSAVKDGAQVPSDLVERVKSLVASRKPAASGKASASQED